jgi:predicted acyltransferase
MFMVGVALPYSFATRRAKGDSLVKIYRHTVVRALILIALGIFLSSNWSRQTNFTFVNVLAQIGLGYVFLCLFVNRGLVVQLIALGVILVGYWAWFASHSLPAADFAYTDAGVFGPHPFEDGAFAHWNKNTNAAADFDVWFLNQFPQPVRPSLTFTLQMGLLAPPPWGAWPALPFSQLQPRIEAAYYFNEGGYQTLNFIPSLATMLLGLIAGELLRSLSYTNIEKLIRLAFAGFICLLAAMVLGQFVCPIVKRIWTPAWVLYSAAFAFWMLAAFYLVVDMWEFKAWAWPLVVVGMNSIAIYVMAQLMKGSIASTLRIHFGSGVFQGTYFGTEYWPAHFEPIARSTAVLFVLWLICVWLYRQKIFIKI